jgi:hypothetical protein
MSFCQWKTKYASHIHIHSEKLLGYLRSYEIIEETVTCQWVQQITYPTEDDPANHQNMYKIKINLVVSNSAHALFLIKYHKFPITSCAQNDPLPPKQVEEEPHGNREAEERQREEEEALLPAPCRLHHPNVLLCLDHAARLQPQLMMRRRVEWLAEHARREVT